MDGVLPFTAIAPPQGPLAVSIAAAPAASAAATDDATGEGGFAGALNRSMAASPSPQVAQVALSPPETTPVLPAGAPAAAGIHLGVLVGPVVPAAVSELGQTEPAQTELVQLELDQAEVVATETPPTRSVPWLKAVRDAAPTMTVPPEAGIPLEEAAAPPPAPPLALPGTPSVASEPAETEAPAEEAEALPAEGSPLLALVAAPPLAPNTPPVGLSASAPQAGLGVAVEAPPTQDGNAAVPAPVPESEGDAPPAEIVSPEHGPPVLAERALPPPPNLTTSLWQAEALAPLSGFDPAAAALRPAEIASAQPAGAAAPPPPPAARQVASVAVALAFAPNGMGGFNLSLEPAELGRVEIRVQREGDTHSVRVTAERPETLALLQRDRHELDRNLAEAGLRIDAGGIAFSLEGHAADGGAGQRDGQREGQRGRDGGGHRTAMNEPAAPPPRLIRSLLDLNI